MQFLVATSFLGFATAAITLPSLLGPYSVTITDHEILTDRDDPLSPTPGEKRRLMTSLYTPVLGSCDSRSTIPYISPAVGGIFASAYAPYGLTEANLSELRLVNCTSPVQDSTSAPLLIFSHGLTDSRMLLRGITTAVASSGYAVLAVDHTYDSSAVEFPNGDVVQGNLPPFDNDNATVVLGFINEVRTEDLTSVLDYVEAGKYPGLNRASSNSAYDTGLSVGAFGHSIGGAASVSAARNDSRVKSALNYDGTVFGPVTEDGIGNKPLYLMGSQFRLEFDEESWETLYSNSTGFKVETIINGTQHNGYMDFPLTLQLLGLRDELDPTYYADRIGNIQGVRMLEAQWRYTLAFFDQVIKGKKSALLEGPREEFPDVVFVKGSE